MELDFPFIDLFKQSNVKVPLSIYCSLVVMHLSRRLLCGCGTLIQVFNYKHYLYYCRVPIIIISFARKKNNEKLLGLVLSSHWRLNISSRLIVNNVEVTLVTGHCPRTC